MHAPFVYDLNKKVISNTADKSDYSDIEKVRHNFLTSNKSIEVTDYGSGSAVEQNKTRHINKIAAQGTTKAKYCQLLARLVEYVEAKEILELGTSLGLTTLYLSRNKETKVTTFEGASSLCAIAQAVFDGNDRSNISLVEGNIDSTLPKQLASKQKIDFAFIDANHTTEATVHYFEWLMNAKHDKSCFVFDDIHMNKGMEKAWKTIISHYEVTLSIDLFQMGIVFLNPEIRKQHYILTF